MEVRSLDSELVDFEALAYRNSVEVSEELRINPRLDETRFETLGVEFTNTARFHPRDGLRLRVSAGAEAFRDRQSGTRDGQDRLQFPDANASYLAAFVHGEADIGDRLQLTAGLRRDAWRLRAGQFPERSEGQFSPRATVGYRLGEAGFVWVGAARGFRVPSLTELFADGLHFQIPVAASVEVLNWFRPNPDLPPSGACPGKPASAAAGARGRSRRPASGRPSGTTWTSASCSRTPPFRCGWIRSRGSR